jgi:hypothetical protein
VPNSECGLSAHWRNKKRFNFLFFLDTNKQIPTESELFASFNPATMQDQDLNPFTECAGSVLAVLERKAFYRDRFFLQVKALYPGIREDRLVPTLYLNAAFARIPAEIKVQAAQLACRKIVNAKAECPSPFEVRVILAESVLQTMSLTFPALYERAKNFLARPPVKQNVADRWLEKVIYTAIRRVSYERFALTAPDDWKSVVTEVMLTDSITLSSYTVTVVDTETPVQKRNFRELLAHVR